MMTLEQEDKELKKIGLELMFLTPEKYSCEDGITYVELAKLVDLPTETVKKKLQILKDKGIVRAVTVRRRNQKLRWDNRNDKGNTGISVHGISGGRKNYIHTGHSGIAGFSD